MFKVNGNFNCGDNKLTSLEGAPKTVGSYFDCDYNKLTSLEGAPETVGGDFSCNSNNLESLRFPLLKSSPSYYLTFRCLSLESQ